MDDLLTIQLELLGGQAVVDEIGKVAAAGRGMNPQVAQLKAVASASNQAAQGQNALARQVQQSANAMKIAMGPAQRLQKAQADLIRANASGNPAIMMDAKLNLGKAQKSFNNAYNPAKPDFGKAVSTFVRSTRFGAGGASPLIGRGLDVLDAGMGTQLGKFAGPVGLAAIAVTGLYKAAKYAADGLMEFSNLRYSTGSSFGQAAQLRGIGMALGVDAGGMSRTLATADYASQSRLGVSNPMGGSYYGNVNEGADFLRAIEALRRMSEQEAIRSARGAGIEGALPLRDLNEAQWKELKQTFESMKPSPEDTAAAMTFNVEMAKMTMELEKLAVGVLPLVTAGVEVLANSPGFRVMAEMGKALGRARDGLNHPPNFANGLRSPGQINEPRTVALNENTRALRELGIKMDGMRRDFFGGGERARGAMPSGMRGEMMRQTLRSGGLKLGAFNL